MREGRVEAGIGRALRALALFAVLLLGLMAPAARAQVNVQLIDTVPPGLTITNAGQFTLQYSVTGTANGVEVNFFRDDGAVTLVVIPNPAAPPPPFQVVLPLRTNVDRDPNQYTAVVRDVVTNQIDLDGPFTVIADDIGPEAPVITTPAFPVTAFIDALTISGTTLNQAAGIPTLPETSGQVVIRRTGTLAAIGGGAITSTSQWVAVASLAGFPIGVPVSIDIFAVDAAGNTGTTRTVQVTRVVPAAPVVTATLDPPSGTITKNPGIVIRGSITGQVSPLTVNIFVDGLLESQITGLTSGQSFIHTLTLPGDGPHTISIQGVNSNTPPDAGLATVLGTVTLDRTAPAAPLLIQPNPTLGPVITRQPTLTIEGFSSERDTVATDTLAPQILLQGPPGVVFTPPSPLPVDNSTGRFLTTAAIAVLADGNYFVDVTAVDEAGNLGPQSTTRITFTVDRTPPQVDRIRVNGILAPTANPEIYVGQIAVPIEVTFSEALVTPPDLRVTQNGGAALPTGRSSTTTRVVTYVHGVVPGFDGPAQVDLSGGTDRAGNAVSASFPRLFVVDTVPPNLVSIDPADGTTISVSPSRIRVRLQDPASPVGTFSGVDLIGSTVTVFGPLGSAGATVVGTQTPFDPFTVDFVPAQPLTAEGTYRVTIVPQDKVGNRAIAIVRSFILDRSPIVLSAANVITNPANGACVNERTIPGGGATPFVEVRVTDPTFDVNTSGIVLRDFCRVPPEVPGRKQVVNPSTMRYLLDRPLRADGTQDGIYAIQIDVKDIAGNASPTFTTTFVYDTVEPSVAQTFPASGTAILGPLRHVEATLLDRRVDFCRSAGGISRTSSTITLTLARPNPNLNTTPAGTQVRGTLRFDSVGGFDRILLEIVDSTGFPRGLRTDGRDDGDYVIAAEAFDCAANTSGQTSATFTYDTVRPFLEVDGLREGGSLGGPDFVLTGRIRDNRGGSGPDRVLLTLEAVDALGNVTTAPFFLDAPAELDPVALTAVDPTVPWTFEGDLRRVPAGTRTRLRVRAFDRADNFDERIFNLTASAGQLPPPQQAAPASDAATSAQLITFSWQPLAAAARFRVRVVTPNGDVIERDTVGNVTALTLNLTGIPDPEGRFTWAVASIDDAGGVGPFSPNRPLTIDRTRPRLTAIDVLDPSPEATGTVNEGVVRFTLHFSEAMDTTRVPLVTVKPQNPGAPALPVQILSFAGTTLQGEVTIREPSEVGLPDPNGLAEIRIGGAFDRAGNEVLPPNPGLALFEIDAGPFFRVGVFANPVDEADVILVVKGFQRDGGLPEDIIDTVTVLITRQGQSDQTPVMHRVSQAAFRGTFRIDARNVAPVRIRVSGRDKQGNAASRTVELAVTRLRPNEPIRIQATALTVTAPAGAVRRETTVMALGAQAALAPEPVPGGELEAVADLDQVGPFGVELAGEAEIVVPPGSLPEDRQGLGLYRRDRDGYAWLGGTVDGSGLTGRVRVLGPMLLMRDRTAPRMGTPRLAWADGRLEVEVEVADGGAGLEPSALEVAVGTRTFPLALDAATGLARASLPAGAVAVGQSLAVQGGDRAGNRGVSSAALVPSPVLAIEEAVAVPNPARSRTRLRYRLSQAVDRVAIELFDAAGGRVAVLDGPTGAGVQDVAWDLADRRGRGVANGVYLARIRARGPGGSAERIFKVVVLR